jgi:hypothetical protein
VSLHDADCYRVSFWARDIAIVAAQGAHPRLRQPPINIFGIRLSSVYHSEWDLKRPATTLYFAVLDFGGDSGES